LQNDKKRKRPAKTEDQLAALEALYTTDRYPSTEAKRDCGTKLGMDLKEVNRWFEGRRRKDSRASKRSKSDAADAAPAAATEAAAAEAPAATPPQEQATTKEAEEPILIAEDVEMVDLTATTQQPTPIENSTAEKPAAAPANAAAPKSTPASGSTLPDMKEIAKVIEELSSEAETLRQRGLAAPLITIPAASADGTPPAPEPFTDACLAAFIVGQQMPLTELTAALHPLFGPPEGTAPAEQQVLTVEALRTRIVDLAVRKSHDPVDNPKGAPARLDFLEAVPKDGKPSMWQWELRDPKILSKAQCTAAAGIKRRAGRVGDRLTAVVNAYEALVKVSAGLLTHVKASKMVDALKKYDTLEKMEAAEAAEQAAVAAKEAEKANQAALTTEEKKRAAEEKEAERKRAAEQKEAEKERLRLEKEAEKERLRQEKEAEKEQIRKGKEAEKEKKLKEAEEAKLAKKTGFKDKEVLHKTANKFMSFFKPGGSGAAAAAAAGGPSGGKSSSVSPMGTVAPSPAGGAPISAYGCTAAATAPGAAPLSAYERRFPRPPPDNLVPQPVQPLSIAKIDAALSSAPISSETAEAEWKASLAAAATSRHAAVSAPPSGIGLPPSWARRPGAVEAAAERLRQMKDTGVDPTAVRTWRRKLIWFSGDSMRPPYYGSWPNPGPNINARRYLGKDETLDYEVMSDLDWEEEPEGSSLSGADDEDDGPAAGEESEVEDSFMVADGYLSEDEGVRLDDDMDVDSGEVEEQMRLLNAATAAAAAAVDDGNDGNALAGANNEVRTRASQAMQVLLDRARRAGKPLVVVRQDVADATVAAGGAAPDGCVVSGDPAALEALAMEVLVPGISFFPPQDPALANENTTAGNAIGAAATDSKPAGTGTGGGAGRPKAEHPDELLPELVLYIMQNTSMLKSALIEGFIAAHPERKMTKKWVGEKITEMAERIGNNWTIRAGPLIFKFFGGKSAGNGDGEATPVPAAAAPTGALERLLNRPHAGTTSKPTPAVPSALRPAIPASNLKAPERLVTTTAAGEAQAQAHANATAAAAAAAAVQGQQQPLVIPETVDGTGDDFWTLLLQHIEAETSLSFTTTEPSFASAFQPEVLARLIHALPAFILDVLLMTANRNISGNNNNDKSKKQIVAAAVRSLRATVDALAHLERAMTRDDATPSQKAWGEARSGSHTASLAGLCREPALFELLKTSITGALGAKAEEDAVAMVSVLVACPALKEISSKHAAAVKSSLEKFGRDKEAQAWDAAVSKN
jgi:actin-related protein